MLSLSFLESTGSIFPQRVTQSGVGFEFIERLRFSTIDALVIIFGIYGVRFPPSPRRGSQSGAGREFIEQSSSSSSSSPSSQIKVTDVAVVQINVMLTDEDAY